MLIEVPIASPCPEHPAPTRINCVINTSYITAFHTGETENTTRVYLMDEIWIVLMPYEQFKSFLTTCTNAHIGHRYEEKSQ